MLTEQKHGAKYAESAQGNIRLNAACWKMFEVAHVVCKVVHVKPVFISILRMEN